MDSESPKIQPVDQLVEILREAKAEGREVVQCHGCFDIVHPGHVRYLRYARSLGDILVVSVTSDELVDKGYDRPYIHQDLRAENLAALEFVDYVCIDSNPTAEEVLSKLQPDVYVKGKEYELSADPRFLKEREIVEEHGGKVIFSSGDVVFSSTHLLERVRRELPMDAEKTRVFCDANGITLASLDALVRSFAGARVVVIGDPILDQYVHCEEMAIASESPVISVAPVEDETFVGGGAMIARQLSVLGADATLVTTLDESDSAEKFREALAETDVELRASSTSLRPVFVKTRYLVEGQKVFKVNEGRRSPLPTTAVAEVAEVCREAIESADLFVITDFGYGLFGAQLVEALAEIADDAGVPYVLDVSKSGSSNLLKFKRPRFATPTEDELRFAFGDLESGLSHLAARYYKETDAERLYLTLGRRGVLYFSPTDKGSRLLASYLPAFNRHPFDTVGAGDAFLSAAALADVAGAPPQVGMYLGSALAALHIAELGNSPTSSTHLMEYLSHRAELQT